MTARAPPLPVQADAASTSPQQQRGRDASALLRALLKRCRPLPAATTITGGGGGGGSPDLLCSLHPNVRLDLLCSLHPLQPPSLLLVHMLCCCVCRAGAGKQTRDRCRQGRI